VSPTHLWPPLDLVEAALDGNYTLTDVGSTGLTTYGRESAGSNGVNVDEPYQAAHLLLPLTELSRRRAAVENKAFSDEWKPGRLVQITVNGSVMGVLLDRFEHGRKWLGWLAASESSWAGAFDVLLEPEDDPFEPLFGVIQTWNPLTLEQSDGIQAKIVGEISERRLAAISAVAQECAAGLSVNVPAEPGRIALRTVQSTYMVLTGTPLGSNDPRREYQNAYRTATAKLIAYQLTHRASKVQNSAPPTKR
jgi:hypothetical protein